MARYQLPNPGLGFVRGLVLRWPGARLLDVRVGAGRAPQPQHWEQPSYRLQRQGDTAELVFDRPDNWAQFSIELLAEPPADGAVAPQAGLLLLAEQPEDALRAQLRGQRIVFLGTARDCIAALPAAIARLRGLAGLFGASQIHVFENDSADGTGDWLSAQAAADADGQLVVHREQGVAARMPRRTERLAYARNRLLDHVLAHPLPQGDWDYLCWADLDGLVGERFSDQGFLSCFQHQQAWDAVFPLSWPIYYDIWALREPTLCQSDYVWDGAHRWNAAIADQHQIHAAVQVLAPGRVKAWLPVQSAFGGFGLYKASAARLGRYVGLQGQGEHETEVCEHVPYHEALVRAGARLYLNPQCLTHIA